MGADAEVLEAPALPDRRESALIADLKPIALEDRALFTAAVAAEPVTGWSYFFPYLQLLGSASARERLLYETYDGSVAVYRLKIRRDRNLLALLVPPFPWNEKLLRRGLERCAAFNRDGQGRIARVAESLAPRVARLGGVLRFNMDEYIYDRAAVVEASGKAFATLRRKLGQNEKSGTLVRPFAATDATACEALIDRWQAGLAERGVKIGPYGRYARSCLRNAEAHAGLLKGDVIEVDGAVAAITFGGPIDGTSGSVMITISDHDHPGLAYLQRHNLLSGFPELETFNDASDSGRPGLRQMKRAFRPIRLHTVYSARSTG